MRFFKENFKRTIKHAKNLCRVPLEIRRTQQQQYEFFEMLLTQEILAKANHTNFTTDQLSACEEIFILGSGASLYELSPREITILNQKTTISLNKYLLCWEEIGVWPNMHFLVDVHRPAPRVLRESIQIACQHSERKCP